MDKGSGGSPARSDSHGTVTREPLAGNSAIGPAPDAGRLTPGTASSPTSETSSAGGPSERASGQTSPSPGPTPVAGQGKPLRKAHSLIDKVYNYGNLYTAWRRVRANKGAHGLDGVTIRAFEADWQKHILEIQRKLKEDRYEPLPVRRAYIPKPSDFKQLRPLGIPVVADRIVGQATLQILDPLFDPQMSARSFGFRKGRKAHQAIATVFQDAKEGFRHVVDADIKSFFDTIDHSVVMSKVRARIADGRVLNLIEAFLKAGISEDNVITIPMEGTPQGGVISPWLSNLVLDDLDKAIESKGWRHVRYADDFVILCRSHEEAEEALVFTKEVLGRLKLSLHDTKTRLTDFRDGFEFLGFHFHGFCLGIRAKSLERFKDKIRLLTRREQGRNVDAILADLNPVVRGWSRYFGVAQVDRLCNQTDSWIRMRIRAFRFKRRCRNDNWRLRSRRLAKWGLLSLQECRPKLRISYTGVAAR